VATSANADIAVVNIPKSEYDVSELMKQSQYDELPPRPAPVENPVAETPAETQVVKPVETPAPVAAPEAFSHPRTMVLRAVALGASMEDIRATPLDRLDEWIHTNEVVAAQVKPDGTPAPDPYGIDALIAENPDYDTPVLKVLRKVAETSEARIAALETENKSVKAQLQRQAQSKSIDAIDEVFAKLNPKTFGAGTRSQLEANSAEAKRRLSVLASAGLKKGDSDAVVKAKIKETAELLYGTVTPGTPAETPSNGTPRITPQQWEKAGLAAPTARQTVEPEGINKAYHAVQELMIQKGMYRDDDESASSLRVPR